MPIQEDEEYDEFGAPRVQPHAAQDVSQTQEEDEDVLDLQEDPLFRTREEQFAQEGGDTPGPEDPPPDPPEDQEEEDSLPAAFVEHPAIRHAYIDVFIKSIGDVSDYLWLKVDPECTTLHALMETMCYEFGRTDTPLLCIPGLLQECKIITSTRGLRDWLLNSRYLPYADACLFP